MMRSSSPPDLTSTPAAPPTEAGGTATTTLEPAKPAGHKKNSTGSNFGKFIKGLGSKKSAEAKEDSDSDSDGEITPVNATTPDISQVLPSHHRDRSIDKIPENETTVKPSISRHSSDASQLAKTDSGVVEYFIDELDTIQGNTKIARKWSDRVKQDKEVRMAREVAAVIGWANTFLKGRGFEARTLSIDFRDGVLMINLLEATFHEKFPASYNLRPKMQVHRLDNYSLIFDYLKKFNVHLLSIDIHELVNGNENQTLVLLWNILRKLTIRGLALLSNSNPDDPDHEKKEKTVSSAGVRAMLKKWTSDVVAATPGLRVEVNDFWTSFKDGKAFAAIVEELAPGSINLAELGAMSPRNILTKAFQTAEEKLGIPSLLRVEDFIDSKEPDEKAVENYLCMLVSAQKAQIKKAEAVHKLEEELSTVAAKKEEEVLKLQSQMEEEKKQFASLQSDINKLQDLYSNTIQSEHELKDQIRIANEERENLRHKFAELSEEIQKSHNTLLESRAKEKALNEEIGQLMQRLDEREKIINDLRDQNVKLNAELYKTYKEYDDVVISYRKKMREKTLHQRTSSRDEQFGALVEQSIIEQKGFQDFMSALKTREGWLIKTRVEKKLAGQKPRKRWFVLKADELFWYKEKNGAAQGSVNLKWIKKIDIKREGQFDEMMVTMRKTTMLQAGNSIHIDLIPDPTKKGNPAKALRLSTVGSLAAEYVQDIMDWAEDINDRICLINYLSDMFDKAKITGRVSGCKEIVNFISSNSSPILKIENKVPSDLANALSYFKDSLITKKDFSIVFNNIGVTDPLLDVICQIVSSNNTMRSICLNKNLLTEKSMSGLAESLKLNYSLEELDLSRNEIKDEGLIMLVEGLEYHYQLKRLALGKNKISDVGAVAFVKAIRQGQDRLKRDFDLTALEFEDNHISDDGCIAFAQLCRSNKKIKSLKLKENLISDIGAIAIAEAIKAGSPLEDVSLAGNQISSSGAIALAEAMASCGRAITVDLSHNKLIGRKGFSSFFSTEKPIEMDMFRLTMNTADQEKEFDETKV